jgi:signal peptidase I
VTGSSMEPAIVKGSLVVVEPVSPQIVRVGDVITLERKGQIITHRVVAIDTTDVTAPVFTTKGDANPVADPEPVRFTGQVGLFRVAIPLAGFVIAYVQAYARTALMVIAAIVFCVSAALLLFRPRDRRSAGVRAPAVHIDEDGLWRDHLGWLRERAVAHARAA